MSCRVVAWRAVWLCFPASVRRFYARQTPQQSVYTTRSPTPAEGFWLLTADDGKVMPHNPFMLGGSLVVCSAVGGFCGGGGGLQSSNANEKNRDEESKGSTAAAQQQAGGGGGCQDADAVLNDLTDPFPNTGSRFTHGIQ